ncbi:MAG: hypothetical protein H0X51_05365 [Parachlamydiaceae bacterium]|nr:hypothetical protein [Parachlamydiaceae bacterium]
MASDILNSIWIGNSSIVCKLWEQDAQKGVNRHLTVWWQIAQINCVDAIVSLMQKKLSTTSTFGVYSMPRVLYLTPFIINFLCEKCDAKKYPRLKKTFTFINSQVGTVCQLAIAVSALWLIFCGQPIGYISLVFIIKGFAERRLWVSSSLDYAMDYIGFAGVNISRFLSGNPFYICIGLFDITALAMIIFKMIRPTIRPKPVLIQATKENLYNILNLPEFLAMGRMRMNPQHLMFKEAPPPPSNTNIDKFQEMYEKFSLTDITLRNLILDKVGRDDHWLEFYSNKNTPEQMIAYVSEGLRRFIQQTGHRKIKLANKEQYEELENRVKWITSTLLRRPNDKHKFEILIDMALFAYYCPLKIINEIKDLYNMICDTHELESLEYSYNHLLFKQREVLFARMLNRRNGNEEDDDENNIGKDTVGGRVLQTSQLVMNMKEHHSYAFAVGILGDDFGITGCDALEGLVSYSKFLLKPLLHKTFSEEIDDFKSTYCLSYIYEETRELSPRTSHFNKVRNWFIEEFKTALEETEPKQPHELPSAYQKRLRELATERVDAVDEYGNGIVFDGDTARLKRNYLAYLLLRLGILEKAPETFKKPEFLEVKEDGKLHAAVVTQEDDGKRHDSASVSQKAPKRMGLLDPITA